MCLVIFLCLNLIVGIWLFRLFRLKQSGGQVVNGEIQDAVDYAAKTHELQTIIEKQVQSSAIFIAIKNRFEFVFFFLFSFSPSSGRSFMHKLDCWAIAMATPRIRFE